MDPLPTDRRTALVTGAARGIGLEVASQLAAAGWAVVVTARDADRAAQVAAHLRERGAWATAARLDLDDPATTDALAAELEGQRLDAVVANAAAFADWSELPSTADLAAAAAVVSTNLFGTWRVLQTALPALRRSPSGRIAVVTSGAGSFGEPQFGLAAGPAAVSYAVSKAALNALVVKLATELRGSGVLVNAVDPGLTATAPGMEAMGARPVAAGAASVLWAVTLPDDGPTGTFTRDGAPLPW